MTTLVRKRIPGEAVRILAMQRMTHEAVTILDTNKEMTGGRRCLNQPRPGNNTNIKDYITLAVAITL